MEFIPGAQPGSHSILVCRFADAQDLTLPRFFPASLVDYTFITEEMYHPDLVTKLHKKLIRDTGLPTSASTIMEQVM